MKKIFLTLSLCLLCSTSFAKHTNVKGYYRSNGTYVQPHHRNGPNHTQYDNFSTKGNVNPYTGKEGTKYPYY